MPLAGDGAVLGFSRRIEISDLLSVAGIFRVSTSMGALTLKISYMHKRISPYTYWIWHERKRHYRRSCANIWSRQERRSLGA